MHIKKKKNSRFANCNSIIYDLSQILKFWNLKPLKDKKCDSKKIDIISLKLILNFDNIDNFEWMNYEYKIFFLLKNYIVFNLPL